MTIAFWFTMHLLLSMSAQVAAFAEAVANQREPTVTLSDGSKAVLMGLAAHRAIDSGMPVLWSDMIAEFDEARIAAEQTLLAAA